MTSLVTHVSAAAQSNPTAKRHSWLRELIAAMPIVILVKAARENLR